METCRVLGEMLMKGSGSYPEGEVCGDESVLCEMLMKGSGSSRK